MAKVIEVSSANFRTFSNLEPGMNIDIIGQGEILDVRRVGEEEIVTIGLSSLEGKPGIIGRFEKMERILNKVVGKDGRIQVTTQTTPMGNS